MSVCANLISLRYFSQPEMSIMSILFQDAELPQFTIMGWETNERKIRLATGTYQVNYSSLVAI